MGVWLSFFAIIWFIGYLLLAEQQQPQDSRHTSYNAQNCTVYSSPTKNQPSSQGKTDGITNECIFRANEEKDGWDYALIVSTIVFSAGLVIIGCFQIYWMDQTHAATESAASAARKQGDILVAIERPWLIAIRKDTPPEGWPLPLNDTPSNFRIVWDAKNAGKSPAFVTFLFSRIEIVDYPLTGEPKYHIPKLIRW
jgi:hypothetical protein